MDFSQKEAAEALGLKRRVVQYYEKGERDGKSIDIPKTVRLACYALTLGTGDYDGPPDAGGHKGKKRHKDKDKDKDKEKSKHKGKGKKHGKDGKAPKLQEELVADQAEKPEKVEKKKSRK